MKTNSQTLPKVSEQARVPQMLVRCDLHAGDDLETCQMNVTKWQERYYDAYNKAQQKGCI